MHTVVLSVSHYILCIAEVVLIASVLEVVLRGCGTAGDGCSLLPDSVGAAEEDSCLQAGQ